jgi:hypothetical protein
MAFDTEKLEGLFSRVLNNKLEVSDEAKFKEYMKETFGNGIPSEHQLQQFNNIVVKQADVLAQQKSYEVLNILAATDRTERGNAFLYTIPQEFKAKFLWSSNGSSVEHVRVEGQRQRTLVPQVYSTGMYYELDALSGGALEHYNLLVSRVADAIVQLKFELITKLFQAAVADQRIPTKNQLTGNNITLDQYVKFASRFARMGGQAVLVGDTSLIDHFALQLPTSSIYQPLLVDDVKRELLESLAVTRIARTTAVNLVNPFIVSTIGKDNERTQLPVNEGYMFASGIGYKPIRLVDFGEPRQISEFNKNLNRIEMDIKLDLAVDFVIGETVGYIKDDSVTL